MAWKLMISMALMLYFRGVTCFIDENEKKYIFVFCFASLKNSERI